MPGFRTLAAAVRHEAEPIAHSRFLGSAYPVDGAEQALAFVAAESARFPEASHVCWAYRLPPNGVLHRTHDAGEPRGSAGVPILKRIEGADLVGVLVVVTRWFGGTKLGVGGLMRAYGGVAAAVLARGALIPYEPTERVRVAYPYPAQARIDALLASAGLTPIDADFGAHVEITLELPVALVATFLARLADATSGQARRL